MIPVSGGASTVFIFFFFPIDLTEFNEMWQELEVLHEERKEKVEKDLD
jgi:hypothetical protein